MIKQHDRSDREIDHDLRRTVLSLADDERDMAILRYRNCLTGEEAGNQFGLSPVQAYRLHDKGPGQPGRTARRRGGLTWR